jgi:hypothetical protein
MACPTDSATIARSASRYWWTRMLRNPADGAILAARSAGRAPTSAAAVNESR